MTTKELLQYRSMCKELTEKSIEAKHRTLSGAVKGSDSEFPYTQHAMAISGMEENEQNRILLQRINKLSMKIKEIELFVGCIDDSLVRRIFEFRYIKRKEAVNRAGNVWRHWSEEKILRMVYA